MLKRKVMAIFTNKKNLIKNEFNKFILKIVISNVVILNN